MSSTNQIYASGSASSPMSEDGQFNQFDASETYDTNSYAKMMHQHTKRQMEAASTSSRRSHADSDSLTTLDSQSSGGSISSMDSARS